MGKWASQHTSFKGFTIVELLIVIVVIAILATITIVAYNGIRDNASVSAAKSSLASGWRKIEAYKVQNSAYPTTLADAQLTQSGYTYRSYNSGSIACLGFTTGGKSYQQVTGQPVRTGDCVKVAVDVWARTSTTLNPEIPSEEPTISGLYDSGNLSRGYGGASALAGGPTDYFVATYRTFINPPVTGTYTISELTDDGAIIYIDGTPIINGWNAGSTVRVSGTVDLVAGQRVELVYFAKENQGGYSISLRWSYPGQADSEIPASVYNT